MSKKAVAPAKTPSTDTSERDLARNVARGLPILTLIAALAVGFASSVGPAILILAGGALLGSIAFFWASVRTMSGDAPLAEDMAEARARRYAEGDSDDRKRRVLRALKDLELERAVGKIDETDYQEIAAEYRAQAKAIMREADADIEPLRAKAEALVQAHLAKRGLSDGPAADALEARDDDAVKPASPPARVTCAACATANEPDARFCKKCGALIAKESDDARA